MFKLIIYILLLSILATAGVWLSSYNGEVSIIIHGYEIRTTVLFCFSAIFVTLVVLVMSIQTVIWLKNIPKKTAARNKLVKQEKGMLFLTEGFTAIASGDPDRALKLAKRTESCIGETPLTKILSVQATQLKGDPIATKKKYTEMLESKDTELIALKGLLKQSVKENNLDFAIYLANKALKMNPDLVWARKVLFELYTKSGRYREAQALVETSKKGVISQADKDRWIGVLLLARSLLAYEEKDYEMSYNLVLDSYKHLKHFPPTVAHMARVYYLVHKNIVKAIKIIENSWKTIPHPDLARAYLLILEEVPYDKRLKKVEKLMSMNPDHYESHILMARVAIDVSNFSVARNHLKSVLNKKETVNICKMMIELEEKDTSNTVNKDEVIKKWQGRQVNAVEEDSWKCHKCGYTTTTWGISCNHCGEFDSLEWQGNNMVLVESTIKDTLNF
ncbi:MAG: hypothetical protein MK137_05500 [Rickettsiales bacterium]|nr:hypothetical protein [Rickettsiales bacterium]